MRKYILCLLLLSTGLLVGQGGADAGAVPTQKEDAKGKHTVKFTGGINFGGELYEVNGIGNRRSPWSYTLNANLGLTVGKFRVPINFVYRDRQVDYDFTFNRFGMSPTLGWATLHLGWRSMNFSPYTLAGRTFFGVGTELTPGKFYVGALYGTLQNPLAVRDEELLGTSLIPIFDRKLYGAKVGYRHGKRHLEVMAVKIYDDPESFDYPENYDARGYQVLTAKDNLLAGINAGVEIAEAVEVYFKTGVSLLTDNAQDPRTEELGRDGLGRYRDLITVNTSSRATFAGDAGLNLRLGRSRIGLQYRRVEPFFATLATPFFQSDVEQFTGLLTTALFKKKLKLNGRVGLERNNLREYRTHETRRLIMNTTAAYRPTEAWNLNLRLANFVSEANPAILELNDTLRYVTATSNASFSGSRTLKNARRDLTITLYTSFQRIDDRSVIARIDELDTYSASLNSGWRWKGSEWTLGPSLQYHRYDLKERVQERFGAGLNVGKSLFNKKVAANFSSTLSQNDVDGLRDGTVGLHRLRFRYRLNEKTSLGLSSSLRHVQSIQRRDFREWRSRLQASYRL